MRIVRVPGKVSAESKYFNKEMTSLPILSPKRLAAPHAILDESEVLVAELPRTYRKQLVVPEQKSKRYLEYVYKSAQASHITRDSVTVELIDRLTQSMLKSLLRDSAEEHSTLIKDYVDDLISSEFDT